eukprot:4014607-Pyramimonas_sp.AAC.1
MTEVQRSEALGLEHFCCQSGSLLACGPGPRMPRMPRPTRQNLSKRPVIVGCGPQGPAKKEPGREPNNYVLFSHPQENVD